MLYIKGIRVSETLADLWEKNLVKYQDDLNFIHIGKDFNGSVCIIVFLNNDKTIRKAVSSDMLKLFESSIQSITINEFGYLLETDLFKVIYNFDGVIESVEEL